MKDIDVIEDPSCSLHIVEADGKFRSGCDCCYRKLERGETVLMHSDGEYDPVFCEECVSKIPAAFEKAKQG